MHRRTFARLVAVFALTAAGMGVAVPAAFADGNLSDVTLPASILVGDSNPTAFTFTTTAGTALDQSDTATFALTGISNLSGSVVTLTCDGTNAGTYVANSNVTFTCNITKTATAHTGSLSIAKGPSNARVVAGTMQVVTTTTSVGVLGATTTGTITKTIAVKTPPEATQDVTSIKADGQPHSVGLHLSNHSPAAGRLGRIDVAFSGLAGLDASTLSLSAADGTPIPVSGTTTLTAELSPHTGFALPDDANLDFTYRIAIANTVHGGSVTANLTFDSVSSSGAVLNQMDSDSHAVTVVNKPTVVPNLPPTVRVNDVTPSAHSYASTFTQQVGNRSGAGITNAEVDYKVTLPAGMTPAEVALSYQSAPSTYTQLPWTSAGGQVYTTKFTGTGSSFALPDSNTTIDTPFKLEILNGVPTVATVTPAGTLQWEVTVVNQSGNVLVSDLAVPVTVAQKAPGKLGTPTATGGNKKLFVSFDTTNNGGATPTTYLVTATPTIGTGAAITGSGTTLPVTVTGLVNNTKYNLTVHATNAYGSGPESDTGNGTPLATPPAAPTIIKIDPFDGYAVATVANPIDDGGSVITSYRASYVRTDGSVGGSSVIEDATDSTITLPGLTNGVSYTVTVRAVNAIGAGIASAPVQVIPNLPGGPTSPVGISISLGATAATIPSGSSVILSGAVARNSDPQQGMKVAISFTGADRKTKVLKTLTTDSLGSFQYKTKPTINGSWTASVTSVSPAVKSPKAKIAVTAVLKNVQIVLSGRTLSATGFVTPGFALKKVRAPNVTIQIVKIVTVSHVKVTRVVKTLVLKKALDNTRSGNPFSLSAAVAPGTYLVRVATTSSYILTSGASKPVTVRVL